MHFKKKLIIFNLLTVAVLMGSLMLTPAAQAGEENPPIPDHPTIPDGHFELLPDDVIAKFQNMTVGEFLALNGGYVPHALEDYVETNTAITVIVEMEDVPVAKLFAMDHNMSALAQMSHSQKLENAQAPVAQYVAAHGGTVIDQYTKAYNGLLVHTTKDKLPALRELAGVKAIHRAPVHYPALVDSLPTIRADEVQALGFDGTGVTIGVIDTGVDYTHAALGGSGNPADYTANDPDILDGGFPNAKVVGGYDFAGTDYDANSSPIPVPDDDPLDEHGHGTHVSSTAAGLGSTDVGLGVAPGATIYALKVFGASGSTNLTASAIEWAMDPNGDGDVSDHLDVINMSLGSDFGPADENDPDIIAVQNAVDAGVVVVASSGNSGDTSYITGSPAAASGALSVAASYSMNETGPYVDDGTYSYLYQPPAFDGDTGHYTVDTTKNLYYTGVGIDPVLTAELCGDVSGATADLTDQIALIQRGSCAFSEKVENAASLGAVGAIIFNHSPGRITMAGDPVTIPAGFVSDVDGAALIPSHGLPVTVSAETTTTSLPRTVDIADFSSRGPRGFDSHLKPEIAAPGALVYAAKMGGGEAATGMGGTSMAAPHVAGVAALILEAHPTWGVEAVKASIMNYAKDLDDFSPVPRVGAGLVDAYKSVTNEVYAIGDPYLVSLSWALQYMSDDTFTSTKTVTLTNDTASAITYDIDWDYDAYSWGPIDFNYPANVVVPAGGTETVDVELVVDVANDMISAFGLLEEYSGYFTFTPQVPASPEVVISAMTPDALRLPFYLIPRPYTELTPLSADLTLDRYGMEHATVEMQHAGPIDSQLWGFPVFIKDTDEDTQLDSGDLRLFGLDYGGVGGYGDEVVAAFDTYGSWHTPQPYFTEFDLYIDIDQDGWDDYVLFNYNYGALTGGDDNDLWVVAIFDLWGGTLDLGSPYLIWTDYNAGHMEWFLPTDWFGLDQVGSAGDTDFAYDLVTFDYEGNVDFANPGQFDVAHPPLAWIPSPGEPWNPGPDAPETAYDIYVFDYEGYLYSQPLGFMLADYAGYPGEGQAHYWPLTVEAPEVYADFDGDEDTDVAVYRPSNGMWYISGQVPTKWGIAGDIPVPGDYDGDGDSDIAVYRPSVGNWYIKDQRWIDAGYPDDTPVPCDYDGDGATDISLYNAASGNWYVRGDAGGTVTAIGLPDDIPVPGDYDGNGTCDIAVYRPSTGQWIIDGQATIQWGFPDDIPVPGDYTGDGATDAAIYRPTTGQWYILGLGRVSWGFPDDIPVPGDYDGDGLTDIAVLRPSNGRWYIMGQGSVKWYRAGDYPLPVRDTNADGDPYQ